MLKCQGILGLALLLVSFSSEAKFVKGRTYGSCYVEMNSVFQNTLAKFSTWPITSCPGAGTGHAKPTCSAGFTLAVAFMSQGNAAGASVATIGQYANQDVYFVNYHCIKD
ncbi:MAG: hypothetical protein AAGB31_01140 [Bdellovibrio sp.]